MVPPADKLTDNGLIGQPAANDTKVIRDTLVRFGFPRQAESAAGMNTKEPDQRMSTVCLDWSPQ